MNTKLKKKVQNFIKKGKFTIPANPIHPKTGLLRFAIVSTAPTRYGKMIRIGLHTYISKWSKSHTAGGVSVKSKELTVIKKAVKVVSSYNFN